jgi:hypothetical protein
MRFVGWRGLSDGYRQAVEGHSPWKRSDTHPEPLGIGDIDDADIPEPLKAVITAERIRALTFVPLMVNETLIGKFMTYYDARTSSPMRKSISPSPSRAMSDWPCSGSMPKYTCAKTKSD